MGVATAALERSLPADQAEDTEAKPLKEQLLEIHNKLCRLAQQVHTQSSECNLHMENEASSKTGRSSVKCPLQVQADVCLDQDGWARLEHLESLVFGLWTHRCSNRSSSTRILVSLQ